MISLSSLPHPPLPPLVAISPKSPCPLSRRILLNPRTHSLKTHRIVPVFARNGRSNDIADPKSDGSEVAEKESSSTRDDGGEQKKDGRRGLSFKWVDLLDPDPDNVVAVGLTGLLTWANVQVVWQLLFISLAIVVAALKYSFVAAVLIFILIAFL